MHVLISLAALLVFPVPDGPVIAIALAVLLFRIHITFFVVLAYVPVVSIIKFFASPPWDETFIYAFRVGCGMTNYVLNKRIPVRRSRIVYKHVFSMAYLYKRCRDWLVEEGYVVDGSKDNGDRWMEKLYLERIAGNGAKQIWIWWRTSRNYPNAFCKFYLDLDFHILGLTSQEIVVRGTKVKTNKGEAEITIIAGMELDPAGEWNKNFILSNSYLQKFFLNRIYKRRLQSFEDELVRDVNRLLGAIKQYFQLESWVPEYTGEPFDPAKGQ